jgi:hypothetical protein
LQDGYAETYDELLQSTDWSKYGYESGNSKCANCMVHSGYEASAVNYTFSWKGLFPTVRAMLSSTYKDAKAKRELDAEKPHPALVQIDTIPVKGTLQGAEIATPDKLADGLEQAFDYRGDVTIKLTTGDQLDGYIFDREQSGDPGTAKIRIMLKSDRRKVTIPYSQIERLAFTGRDMADGRSWEAWVKKYTESKAAGKKNIELVPEAID